MRYSLIDQIVVDSSWGAELAGAQVIRVDNVDAYWWKVALPSERYTFFSFPNVAMPFTRLFLSCETPSWDVIENHVDERYGVYFFSSPVRASYEKVHLDYYEHFGTNRLKMEKAGVSTMTFAGFWFQPTRVVPPRMIGYSVFAIKSDGGIYGLEGDFASRYHDLWYAKKLSSVNGISFEEGMNWLEKLTLQMFAVGLFSISLMNCKNVVLVDGVPTRQEKRDAALAERKKQIASAKWKILNIEPMQRVLSIEGKVESVGLGQALHICRGHFKDYRQGKGLFGKHKSIYWWDQQMRGNDAAGVIIKDYNVLPPVDADSTGVPK